MFNSNMTHTGKILYRTRHFISGSIKRDIKSRYANTLLGPVWVLLQPLMMILIYTLVFSKVMQSRLPESTEAFSYSIHLCAALIPWMFFTDMLSRLQGMYVDNAGTLKKLAIPRFALTAVATGTSAFNFIIFMLLYILFLIIIGKFPVNAFLYSILPLAIQITLTLAAGTFFAIANAHFRDTGHFIGVMLQLGFWFTPIVYPFSVLPEWTHAWMQLNPFVGLSRYYQSIFLLDQPGSLSWLLSPVIWTLIFCSVSIITHKHHGRTITDVL